MDLCWLQMHYVTFARRTQQKMATNQITFLIGHSQGNATMQPLNISLASVCKLSTQIALQR